MRLLPQNPLRQRTTFISQFNVIWVVQFARQKYIASHFPQISSIFAPSRLIEEGRTRRHDTWSAGSGGREAPARARHCRAVSGFVLEAVSNRSAQDERRYCVRQKRVVLAPVAGVKSAEVFAKPNRVRKTVNSPMTEARGIRLRGERAISRQTIAQGRPDALRWTCMLVCALLCALARETAGAARTRSSLRPLIPEGGK